MKTIIAGSRGITDIKVVERAMNNSRFTPTEIVCGCARGVDMLGAEWAKRNKVTISWWPADWKAHGRAAGIFRNRQMARHADALVAVWDGKSPGTRNMIETAREYSLEVYVEVVK